jgi:hypothetical protein
MKMNKKISRLTGALYLIIIASGMFAEFFVRGNLIVPGDASATTSNIIASESLFRLSIFADLIMVLCDIGLAILFYLLLKPVSKPLALLASFFRLAQATSLGVNLLNMFFVLQIIRGANYLSVFDLDQLQALIMMFLDSHSTGYTLALVFFGCSLIILGILMYKSGYFPKALGIMIIVAALAYLLDASAKILLSNYIDYQEILTIVVLVPAFIGELSLCLWLLFKGVEDDRLKQLQHKQ